MDGFWKAALCVAGFVVASGATAGADQVRPASLTSFGTTPSLSAYQLSAPGIVPLAQAVSFSKSDFTAIPFAASAMGAVPPPQDSFAASLALSSNFALDGGYNADVAQRFNNYDSLKSPLLDSASVLGLANGGAYAGATWMPESGLHLRLGANLRSDRLDNFAFAPGTENAGLPLGFDTARSRSLLAGASFDVSDWAKIGLTAIHNDQLGAPFGIDSLGHLSGSSKVSSNALSMTAQVKLGDNWVTTASADIAGSLSQLDQRLTPAPQSDNRSYSIAIAKHGLFGDDAVGFSFSRPAPGMLDNGFDMVAASGDQPPAFIASGRLPGQTPETDLQLGYVTSFANGAVALQTNAAYQMNYQGQSGTNSVSVLSRAKIKF
jgi:hypothetical protein